MYFNLPTCLLNMFNGDGDVATYADLTKLEAFSYISTSALQVSYPNIIVESAYDSD